MHKPILNKHLFIILLLIFTLTFSSIIAGKIMAWVYVVDEESPQINNAQIGGGYFGGGEGTELNPYLIQTSKHFSNLALLQFYEKISDKTYFSLENDIDFSSSGWLPPIGTSQNSFIGVFNGNGHVLENLKITTDNVKLNYTIDPNKARAFDGIGVFGNVGSGASITSFNISNAIIETSTLSTDNSYIGYICGIANGSLSNIGVHNSSLNSTGKRVVSETSLIGDYTGTLSYYDKVNGNESGINGNGDGGTLILNIKSAYDTGLNSTGNTWNTADSSKNSIELRDTYNALDMNGAVSERLSLHGTLRFYNESKYAKFIILNNKVALSNNCGKKTITDILTTAILDGSTADLTSNQEAIRFFQRFYVIGNNGLNNDWQTTTTVSSTQTSCSLWYNNKGDGSDQKCLKALPITNGKVKILVSNHGEVTGNIKSKNVTTGVTTSAAISATTPFQYVEFNVEANNEYNIYADAKFYISHIEFDGVSTTGAGGEGSDPNKVPYITGIDFISTKTQPVSTDSNYTHSYSIIEINQTTAVSGSEMVMALYVVRTDENGEVKLQYNTNIEASVTTKYPEIISLVSTLTQSNVIQT